MALNLLNSFGIKGVDYGLYNLQADVTDTQYLSQFFVVSEFNPQFTAGKNAFSFNGSTYLQSGSLIYPECLDSQGHALYMELAQSSDVSAVTYAYKEGSSFVFSIHVFDDTAEGVGHIILYGTLIDGRTVKWMQNITINKTLKNTSRVRFYQSPVLEVDPAEVPILSSNISLGLVDNITFTGTVQGLAVTPPKDTNLDTINKRNTNIDYRLTLINPVVTNTTADNNAFNSQMVGATVNLNINTIQSPLSTTQIPVSATASYVITNVINNNTLQISTPYYYKDQYGNNAITNIVNANFSIQYPFITYNNATASYQTTNIGGVTYIVQQSYADITYRNIRTFSGYVARHKIYRKSLLTNSDFSVIADEPIAVNELLADNVTQNSYYSSLGTFYNNQHIDRYWFTSSNNISLHYSPSYAVNSMFVSSPSYTSLSGSDYFMVKNDSIPKNRNAQYVPFDMTQFLEESGSAYDSNFMALKANVQYIVEISAVIMKNPAETTAGLSFYFTSSIPAIQQEPAYTNTFGVNIANVIADTVGESTVNFNNLIAFFTPQNDLYGTLVVVPRLCQAYIRGISFRVYGDDGFSPDAYSTRIPWPVSVANECFDIKAELFDINSSLVYSDLEAFQNFDPSGSTLVPYIPGGGSYKDLFVSGTLYVSKSAIVQYGDVYIPNMLPRPGGSAISQSRIISVASDGSMVFDPMVDATYDSEYLYLTLDASSNRTDTTQIATKKSLASEYNSSTYGRKIYWSGSTKIVQTAP
jgi:hypothetical protein